MYTAGEGNGSLLLCLIVREDIFLSDRLEINITSSSREAEGYHDN